MKTSICAAAALGALLTWGATGCGAANDSPKTLTVAGRVTVSGGADTLNATAGDPCENNNSSGYGDINAGAQVVVKNSSGRQLGVGELGGGTVTSDNLGCRFTFRLTGVARGSSYSVVVANRPPYSFTAAKAGDLRLTLGG